MSKSSYNKNNISLIQLSNYVKPDVVANMVDDWVLNGKDNSFFQYIIDRYNGSTTNRILIDTYVKLYYGQGIAENGKDEVYPELAEIMSKREQKKCLSDLKMFGQYDMQVIRAKGGGVASILHVPTNKIAPQKADKNGIINNLYYSEDWSNRYRYTPKKYPAFKIVNGKPKDAISIKSVRPYTPGKFYFTDPDYLSALQYAETEEEISNFFINHIQNGLTFGYIVNLNNGGDLNDEEKQEIENKIKNSLTGTTNAGKFIISFNDGKDAEVTIVPLEVNDAHNQWEFLVKEARQQLITSHGAFPNLFGVDSGSGFANNADELDVQSRILQDLRITPQQELFIDELAPILELNNLETDLSFIPLRDTYKSTEEPVEDDIVTDDTVDEEENEEVELNEHTHLNIDTFIRLGEDVDSEEWEVVDYRDCHEMNIKESQLNTVFEFASTPKTSSKNSGQDTKLFKIRYEYAGNPQGEREFCNKVISSSKVYREEDLNFNSVYNEDFAPKGKNSYNVFLYKGGVNCKHWWKRIIFLKKDNKKISVNEAKKLVLQLDPEDRKDERLEKNDPKVAQSASSSNNWWSLDPNYRK